MSSAWSRWVERDHTRGSLTRSLAVLAVPLLITSAANVVFQLVDLELITGLGEDATTAVVVTNQSIRQIIFMLVMGTSFGAQGWIARCIGEGRSEAAEHVAGQVMLFGLVISLSVAALSGVLGPFALDWMLVSDEVSAFGLPYAQWTLVLAFGFVFTVLLSAILAGAGDTTTPMVTALLQTAIGLPAEWALIYGRAGMPELGVRGVVLGVALAQLVTICVLGSALFRGSSRIHLRLRHLVPDASALRQLLGLSWPPAIQMVGGFAVNVLFLRLAGELGGTPQAAYSIGLRLGMIGPMIAFPIAGACSTLVAQNLGSGDLKRTWRALGVGVGVHCALLWSIGLVFVLFNEEIVSTFATRPEVIRIGAELLLFQAGAFFFWGFYFPCFRTLQAAGDVAMPMLLSVGNSLIVTIPLGFALTRWMAMGPTGLFAATLASSVVVTVTTGAWLLRGRWTRRAGSPASPVTSEVVVSEP